MSYPHEETILLTSGQEVVVSTVLTKSQWYGVLVSVALCHYTPDLTPHHQAITDMRIYLRYICSSIALYSCRFCRAVDQGVKRVYVYPDACGWIFCLAINDGFYSRSVE